MREMIIRVAAILVGLVLFGAGIGALFLADLGVGRGTSYTTLLPAYSIVNRARSSSG